MSHHLADLHTRMKCPFRHAQQSCSNMTTASLSLHVLTLKSSESGNLCSFWHTTHDRHRRATPCEEAVVVARVVPFIGVSLGCALDFLLYESRFCGVVYLRTFT